ncbi:DUF6265 family protein [Novosphingobium bradum]|uniref:DUF6265 family protein n=1 Tax=Novosphingobium bradum TaxID=1737444 RepID=A0ABV7IQA9_9SPHN
MRLIPFACSLALALAPIRLAAATALPDWLAGTWARQDGAAWADELWTAPRVALMLGLARDGFGPEVNGWTYQRIERAPDGALALVLQDKGGAAARYPLAVASEAAIEFANPARPFPQRIRYWREGQLLMVEMSRIDGSDARRWNYRPVAPPVD